MPRGFVYAVPEIGVMDMAHSTGQYRGFTLIELMIVVIILGILAVVVMVSVGNAGQEARETTLRNELQFMRTQVAVYAASHSDPPGIDPESGQLATGVFEDQLTMYTDYNGRTGTKDATHTFAPYVSQIPFNPVTGKNTVKLVPSGVAMSAAVDGSTAWLYRADTLEFAANSTEYGPTGRNW